MMDSGTGEGQLSSWLVAGTFFFAAGGGCQRIPRATTSISIGPLLFGMSHACALESCGKPNASQRCPTCRELQIPEQLSYFCDKACFQKAWAEHKVIHQKFKEFVQNAQMQSCKWRNQFEGHAFTGPLRPFPVSEQLRCMEGVPKPDYADDKQGRPFSEIAERGKKFSIAKWTKPQDVADMRRAGEIAREVTDIAARAIRVGITGDELDRIVHKACMERCVYPSPLNYSGFPKSV